MEERAYSEEITALLLEVAEGGATAQGRLADAVYQDLRKLAGNLRGAKHQVEPTALVHEAWLRLTRGNRQFEDRNHFFCVAARAMRALVVDQARSAAMRRASGETSLKNEPSPSALIESDLDILDLDAALHELQARDEELAKLIELKFFAGLSMKEAADSLSLSLSGAERRWRLARAWLHKRLTDED